MDTLTIEELKKFIPGHTGWHISLFMPTEHQGQETGQNRIRFKNLLKEAEQRLLAKDIRTPDVRALLQPTQDLLERPGFWRHQSHGLAVFLTSQTFEYYRLSISFDELMIISDSFHIKPLLPFFSSDGHFYILALSQNQVRLMEGTRDAIDEIQLENMPKSMAEALQYERFIKDTQFHTGTSTARHGNHDGMFHGHDPSDDDKNRILRWFQKIDDTLPNLFVGGQSPMVLAGVEYLFPLYKQANSYPHLVDVGIPGSPEELKARRITCPGLADSGTDLSGNTRKSSRSLLSIIHIPSKPLPMFKRLFWQHIKGGWPIYLFPLPPRFGVIMTSIQIASTFIRIKNPVIKTCLI
jgi:hypothetical protein